MTVGICARVEGVRMIPALSQAMHVLLSKGVGRAADRVIPPLPVMGGTIAQMSSVMPADVRDMSRQTVTFTRLLSSLRSINGISLMMQRTGLNQVGLNVGARLSAIHRRRLAEL